MGTDGVAARDFGADSGRLRPTGRGRHLALGVGRLPGRWVRPRPGALRSRSHGREAAIRGLR